MEQPSEANEVVAEMVEIEIAAIRERGAKYKPVLSSQVNLCTYDTLTGTLLIDFNSGSYIYLDFPIEKWMELIEAKSVGSFIHKEVKGHYSFKRISVSESGKESVE